jgi:uncharacterized protein (TIGR02996 family)
MNSDQAFLDAIFAKPNDAVLKGIYATWLKERGDPRAEYLRAATALTVLPAEDEQRAGLEARVRQLRPLVTAEWLAVVDRPRAEDEVREVAFRRLFESWNPQVTCFVEVGKGQDPSPDLLDRLQDLSPHIRPVSASKPAEDEEGVVDRETGERGILFTVETIRWANPSKCEADGGYYLANQAASGETYQVELTGGKWVITDVRQNWIA